MSSRKPKQSSTSPKSSRKLQTPAEVLKSSLETSIKEMNKIQSRTKYIYIVVFIVAIIMVIWTLFIKDMHTIHRHYA